MVHLLKGQNYSFVDTEAQQRGSTWKILHTTLKLPHFTLLMAKKPSFLERRCILGQKTLMKTTLYLFDSLQ